MSEKIQLFCIPYAGGTAGAFRELAGLLGEEVLVSTIEYSGHGSRKSEEFYRDFAELAEDVYGQMQKVRRKDLPYGIFGYSMGSVAVYELLYRYLAENPPKHIFLAAHEAPDIDWDSKKYADLDDDGFMDMLIGFGGFDEENRKMMKNRFFRRLYFQPIREDYRLLAEYKMQEFHPLPADATMFYSPADIPTEKIETWKRFAGGELEFVPLGRNHFFIREHAGEMAEIMRKKMGQ